MPTHHDLLLGQIAIRKGFITITELLGALDEQARDTPPGKIAARIRRYQRPLGVILVARGHLTDAQLLVLLQEQQARFQLPAGAQRIELGRTLFGRIVIREKFAKPSQVTTALRLQSLQRRAVERGAVDSQGALVAAAGGVMRLGQILVQRGALKAEQVVAVLQRQTKAVLKCAECGRRYNVAGFEVSRSYRCRRCGALLAPDPGTLAVDESGFLPPVSLPAAPPGTGDTRRLSQ